MSGDVGTEEGKADIVGTGEIVGRSERSRLGLDVGISDTVGWFEIEGTNDTDGKKLGQGL